MYLPRAGFFLTAVRPRITARITQSARPVCTASTHSSRVFRPMISPFEAKLRAASSWTDPMSTAILMSGLLRSPQVFGSNPFFATVPSGAQDLIQRVGHLIVYRSQASWESESMAWRLRRDNGIAWDEFSQGELQQLDPNLSRGYVKGVLVRENGHTTNPHRLIERLAQAFLRDGGRIERRCAVGFEVADGRLTAIRCAGGPLPVDAAVVAAGIWSKPLAAELGDHIPLETERGYHLMIRDPAVVPRIPTADAECKFVATSMEMGLRLAGTVELAGLDAPPNWKRARILLTHARRMFPALRDEVPDQNITTWMGHRPSMPDSLPVIGPSRRTPDVVYAFGHGHIGMTCAAKTGKTVAELISGEPPHVDVGPFSPRRVDEALRS